MVGRMAGVGSRERVGSLMDAVSFAGDIPSKLHYLRLLRQDFSLSDPLFLSHYLPALLKLHSDHFSPVRKFVTQMIGEIVSRHSEHLAEIVPMLTVVIDDDTPAVARQAISCGTDIFRCTLEKVAVQGLRTSELDDSLELAWACVLKLKEKIYSIAFQPGSDGRRLVALKFVEMIVLIYTPDPNGSQEPPPHQVGEGSAVEFNISWVRKGHPILKFGDLSIEARQSLGLLLDQLRMPNVKSLSTSVVVVLINCLSAIAKRRPSFYGRILPVLLGLESSNSVFKAVHAYGVQHALKNAFLSCLKCTHASATPWRDRLVAALREMKVGGLAGQALGEVCSINVNVKENKDDAPVIKEEKSLVEGDGLLHDNKGRKRTGDLEFAERREDDLTPGKRIKSMPAAMAVLTEQSNADHTAVEGKTDSSGHATAHNDGDSGPVHQLVALFGALVAQGEKAIASLEILISSISADLLAEVVIANMRYLPSTCPKTEADEKPPITTSSQSNVVDSDTPFGQLSSFLSNALSSESSQQKASVMDVQPEAPDDIQIHSVEELQTVTDGDILCAPANEANENAATSSNVPHTSISYSTSEVKVYSADTSEFQDTGAVDAVIPGLDSVPTKGLPDTAISSALASTDVDGGSIDQVTSSGKRSQIDSLPSISTERSEELSSKTVSVDPHGGITSTATSLAPVQQFSLPKMSAPVVDLAEEQRDQLQKLAFLRIVEAYKQVAMAGGLQLRFSLLAYLGVEFPLELDPWSIIQKHILSDYLNHEGHEFTLRVLYRLYGEAEEDRDFFSSTTATSVYEMFLHTVAETLRDSFPASDKSLNRLLAEVPYLPKSIIKLLECLCSPDSSDKNDSESHSGDRVTQGLSIVWSLIMLRPSSRDVLLKVALQSAVHHLEEVRMKAIRLVANKLYPLSSIALQIEEFAREKLLSAAEVHTTDTVDTEETGIQPPKSSDIELSPIERPAVDTTTKDMPQISELSTSGSVPTALITEAQRCTSLYFALCTKKHSLLRQIFSIYKSSPWYIKKEVHRHMPILIRTVGASPTLLEIISDPPDGSDGLLMQVLHTLTDGTIPPPELIASIQKLYESRIKDVEILFPILPFLPKEEVLRVFPRLVNLPADKFLAALACLTQASSPTGPVLGPSEILIAIHGIDPDRDRIPLKKVTDACNACFEQKQTFTQQVIAKVLNQLVEQIPLPFLFMRTVLQATGAFPALVDFIMEILSRLVSKQIWKSPKLWVGFLKCAAVTQPHSFSVLLQLPPAQLENALTKTATLKAPLAAHASQPDIKATLPRSILLVLGIAPESQPPSQAETSQTEAGDAASSDKDMRSEKSKESSGAS